MTSNSWQPADNQELKFRILSSPLKYGVYDKPDLIPSAVSVSSRRDDFKVVKEDQDRQDPAPYMVAHKLLPFISQLSR